MQPAIRTVSVVVAIIVATLLLALYMAFYGLRTIFNPVEQLTATARQIRAGDLQATAKVDSHDELGELATAFNGMTRDLRETLDELNSEIIERESRELALEKSERYNRTLFEETPIGLALATMEGRLVDVNEAYAQIVGRSIDEVMRLSYLDITPVEYLQAEQQKLAGLERSGRYGPYEKEYIHADGHRVPVLLNGLIIEDEENRYIWSTVEDITERKRLSMR
ncbi:PAS domain S-box protein [Candidatus Reidiella endopervernicosa]|uniref:histidine kinase n=1 Tax=Candidatus Reidiella endopervernicosa TaxID=2738883 RepID=A0A6N0HS97_9GAMM|nr:PAS domain S-box protein [Candidatus Reidiella endopervernicosa]QKQ25238.1 PAS domain S-box protein [Candidatus Reidiella endopervernicosa]